MSLRAWLVSVPVSILLWVGVYFLVTWWFQ